MGDQHLKRTKSGMQRYCWVNTLKGLRYSSIPTDVVCRIEGISLIRAMPEIIKGLINDRCGKSDELRDVVVIRNDAAFSVVFFLCNKIVDSKSRMTANRHCKDFKKGEQRGFLWNSRSFSQICKVVGSDP